MTHFLVEARLLPHEGVMPGAAGHKKRTVPVGTEVFVILARSSRKLYWACYLDRDSAERAAKGLAANLEPGARHRMSLETLIAWNFKHEFPKRVVRPKPTGLQIEEVWS